jgi:acetolactate synthase-1/2/3 large subunit
MKGTAADILVKYLEQEGVEFLFGVPGGHLLPLYDAVYRAGTIKPILSKHEGAAAFMACGYALTSGRLGVCCGTVGPGATNLVTGVAEAYADSIPMLAITAQVGTTAIGKGALQEGAGVGRTINQVALFDKITKSSMMVTRGRSLGEATRRALRVAHSGRPGPVHIDLPADVQQETVDEEVLPVSSYRPMDHPPVDRTLAKPIAEILLTSKKPAILAGAGCLSRPTAKQLQLLSERLHIPVATTLRGKGVFPEDHPMALGCVGLYGSRTANGYLRSGLDVLLVLGSSLHEFTTHVWDGAFLPSQALIQVDIDPTEIGKNYPVTHPVVADASSFLDALVAIINHEERPGNDLDSFKQETQYLNEPAMTADVIPIKPQRLVHSVRQVLPRDATVLADIGNTLTWAERYFCAYPEGRFIALGGLAAMGSATAASIGAKLGRPDAPTVCLCGDGDFMMTGMEVATAANHSIPVIWVVFKNTRLGMIYDVQTVSYHNHYVASTLGDVDFVALARSLGAEGYHVERPDEIQPVLTKAMNASTPVVVEVVIDPQELPPVKPRMLALRRSLGLPDPMASFSWDAVKALWRMRRE